MWQSVKKWLKSDGVPHFKPETKEEVDARMVGEPVTSFIASLKREPKRYKIERVSSLKEFPDYKSYHWMHKGVESSWKLTDRKTGNTYGAYVHEEGRVYAVYGLPFSLNWWEYKALYDAFKDFRAPALARLAELANRRSKFAREQKQAVEKDQRLEYAKLFKE